ncbi:MAG: MBL fold metallo-hydrolase [Candidatus Omnitrophica bacterium]|nr:MBL fold metallo-hydrolase [Candidatus Omnitrophota bacterium]
MEITILGSGTGVPSLKRNAAGLIIRIANENLLFDTGPGTLKRLLEKGITYHDLDYILYTHFHTDHTLDLPAILFAAKYALSLRAKELTIIGPGGLERFYNSLLNLYGDVIRPESYVVSLREIQEEELKFGAYNIKTMRMDHAAESLGYRVESDGKVMVYSGDTDVCENIVKLGQNADILILDCSFPDEMKVKGHLIPQEAGRIAKACNCKKLVLSHFYPVCENNAIAKQASRTFKGEVIVASDLMSLNL